MREVSGMLASQIQDLAPSLLGMAPTSKGRTEWRFRGRGSLAICIAGSDRGQWFDHEAGNGGDALDLVAFARSCDRKAAWRWGLDWLGQAPVERLKPPPPCTPQPAQPTDAASVIWSAGVAPACTPVEVYLRSRGLQLEPGAPLRFHPACPRGADRLPAMIALMTDPITAKPVGVHRTFLKPDGSGKADVSPAKMMLGNAGIIRLTPDEDVAAGLGISEGIENGLAIMRHVGWSPIWACGSAGGIARLPVLAGIEALSIFADADDKGAGLKAANACVERWCAAGREVTIQQPPNGTDWLVAIRRAA